MARPDDGMNVNEFEKILVPQPTQPWHQDHKKGGGTHPRVEREMSEPSKLQGNTVLNPRGILAICGKLREARCEMGSRSSHISGVMGRMLSHQPYG